MGRKNWLPTVQQRGHWRPSRRARDLWSGELGGGKSTRSAGTVMKDWVMALPEMRELIEFCARCLYAELTSEDEGKRDTRSCNAFDDNVVGHFISLCF